PVRSLLFVPSVPCPSRYSITPRACPAGASPLRSDSSDNRGHEALHARQPPSHHRPGIALVAAAVHLAGRRREVHTGRTHGVGFHAVPQHHAMHLLTHTVSQFLPAPPAGARPVDLE